jgi:hypothetical protein
LRDAGAYRGSQAKPGPGKRHPTTQNQRSEQFHRWWGLLAEPCGACPSPAGQPLADPSARSIGATTGGAHAEKHSPAHPRIERTHLAKRQTQREVKYGGKHGAEGGGMQGEMRHGGEKGSEERKRLACPLTEPIIPSNVIKRSAGTLLLPNGAPRVTSAPVKRRPVLLPEVP